MRLPKFLKWEFWPFPLVYIPVYFSILFHGIARGKLTYFLAANPGMKFGGFVEYSKYESLKVLPQRYLPKTLFFPSPPDMDELLEAMADSRLEFPVILKPDVGERGYGVEKIRDTVEARNYLNVARRALLLQEYIPDELEYGVMLVQDPRSRELRITSIVQKQGLEVTGDGTRSLEELVKADDRCRYHISMLKRRYAERWEQILPADERFRLTEIGNHARGATFLDANRLISPSLAETFAPLAAAMPGFYLGRLDIKTKSEHSLLRGDFKVIEVNGVNSEPAHIYDPNYGLLRGWKDLLTHWKDVAIISKANMEAGHSPESARRLFKEIRSHYWQKK
ncbi:D-alanine--D-alanine ligase [Salinispira pacifica]|uniref:D-alanine-D-alanine ligase n=1 Tax=Salinispira pacifica TaxID=1307761 RepID=V5WEX5_9SPIO|nr:D-alanine--D-alanine ligase [Salinispira pacifica]AHC14368.1 D-alanine-D-alanine ligase [Salinispira pacifica]